MWTRIRKTKACSASGLFMDRTTELVIDEYLKFIAFRIMTSVEISGIKDESEIRTIVSDYLWANVPEEE